MKRVLTYLSIAIVISVLSSASLWAQATAQISGTVKDQTGAVLPGVEVTATRTDTGVARNAVTNETGSYVLANLPLGPYRLEAALPGFRTYIQTGIVLQVNSNPVVNPVLEVGQVTEQVEVQANAALVETRNVGVGQVIENQRISGASTERPQRDRFNYACGLLGPDEHGRSGRRPGNGQNLGCRQRRVRGVL
jgi:Carboxypeptidase regulatory-like domain